MHLNTLDVYCVENKTKKIWKKANGHDLCILYRDVHESCGGQNYFSLTQEIYCLQGVHFARVCWLQ